MNRELMRAYQESKELTPLFEGISQHYPPLTYEDSLTSVPNYPFCTLGVLNAEGEWGKQKGIAFVVEDNYLLTCASNCYSHKHGEYPNITFTINSNRKHGYDTYKIADIFIPEEYKNTMESSHNKYGYALLYIKGEPNLKDKYGSLSIGFYNSHQKSFTYFCAINDKAELQMIAEQKLSNINQIPLKYMLNGMPRIRWSCAWAQVDGLFFRSSKIKSRLLVKFWSKIKMSQQLAKWAQKENGMMTLNDIPAEGMDLSCFKNKVAYPIRKIYLRNCSANKKIIIQLLSKLPFSSFSQLFLDSSKVKIDLSFLGMNKFAHLKQILINYCKIGTSGCKKLVDIPLPNLRQLCLINERPVTKATNICQQATGPSLDNYKYVIAKWIVRDCNICSRLNSKICSFCIYSLHSLPNRFHRSYRINSLSLVKSRINKLDLSFLKAPNWKWLSDLNLQQNMVGNHGCKMIKQSGCAIRHLKLDRCQITDSGVKWLCKANTSRMCALSLANNKIGLKGCLFLTKTNFLHLTILEYHFTQLINEWVRGNRRDIQSITTKGFRMLLTMDCNWAQQFIEQQNVLFELNLKRQ